MQIYKARKWHKNKFGQWVWVEGYAKKVVDFNGNRFSDVNCGIYTHPFDDVRAEMATLSRYTGADYKEQRIFENDVIREWVKDDQEPEGGAWSYSVIKMHQGSWCVCGINYEYSEPEPLWDRLGEDFEIYGSLLDHPELVNNGTQPSN